MSARTTRAARGRGRRLSRPLLALLAACIAALGTVGAIVASAVVPTFPDNLVVFPDRDFVSVEGFGGHAGETATLEIRRNGTLMGSAEAVVDGGDVAFEVNHPGGVCWGAGTGLNVTPDIQPGDVAVIKFPDGSSKDVAVQDTQASDAVQDGTTVRVFGHIDPKMNKDFFEQRIINP